MNTTSDQQTVPKQDAVEALLKNAAPRPTPPADIEQEIRAAVHSEWATAGRRRRRWRAVRNLAVAATVVVAAIFTITQMQQVAAPAIEVARLDKSQGAVQVQTGNTQSANNQNALTILTGHILQTGKKSAAGLEWVAGGSLRVDAQSRIEFVAPNEIYLHRGRVYFDSFGAAAGSRLIIRSQHGVVSHVGTQFMTASNDVQLVITVREGEVFVEGRNHSRKISQGQRAKLSGSSRATITNTNGIGPDWDWIEPVAPNISVDGRSAFEFLHWVSRQTGYTIEFASETAEQLARDTLLKGTVAADPRNELRMRMMTMDLDAQFDTEGAVITVSDHD
jgi:hypothetical protein